MLSPSSSRKRPHHEIDHSGAEKTSNVHLKGPKKSSKAFKKFEAKVKRVLNGATPTGKYIHNSTIFLPATQLGWCTISDRDMGNPNDALANQNLLEFFSPRQFKDAEGVLFNGKTPTYNSWTSVATALPLASGTNMGTAQITKVNSSSAMFYFKNVSQRQMTLEMYICYGKGSGTTPREDVQNAFVENGNVSIFQAVGAPSAEYWRNQGTSISGLPSFHQSWDTRKVAGNLSPERKLGINYLDREDIQWTVLGKTLVRV